MNTCNEICITLSYNNRLTVYDNTVEHCYSNMNKTY